MKDAVKIPLINYIFHLKNHCTSQKLNTRYLLILWKFIIISQVEPLKPKFAWVSFQSTKMTNIIKYGFFYLTFHPFVIWEGGLKFYFMDVICKHWRNLVTNLFTFLHLLVPFFTEVKYYHFMNISL